MKPIDPHAFDRKLAEAACALQSDNPPMIRTHDESQRLADSAALAVIWGGAFFFIGVAVRHVPPLTYVWLRLSIAAVAMWIYVKVRGGNLGLPRQVWGAIVLLALLNNALPFALFGWGQTHIASGLASILNATTPIWGVVVAHFLTHDERMSPRKVIGVLLGFGGVATMIGPALLSNIGTNALAQLACVTASLSYALAAVWARRFRRIGVSPIAVTTGQLTAGALIMLPVSLIVDQPWTHPFPPLSAWAAITALALFCTAFGYVLYFRLIDHAGATNALLVTLLVPPVAILLGGAFLDETARAAGLLRPRPDRARPGGDRRAAAQPAVGRAGFRKQFSRFGARPVEVADIAPDFLALCVEQDRGRKHLGIERARQRHLRILIGLEVRRSCASRNATTDGVRPHVLADRDHAESAVLRLARRSSVGSSFTQGAHHVAHRFTSIGFPEAAQS